MSWMKAAFEKRSVELGLGGSITPEVMEAMTPADMARIGDELRGRPPGTTKLPPPPDPDRALKFFHTDAPRDYDGFSTTTFAVVGEVLAGSRKGGEVRLVGIQDRDVDWQLGRYASGMNRVTSEYCKLEDYVRLGDWKLHESAVPEPPPETVVGHLLDQPEGPAEDDDIPFPTRNA